MSFNNDKGKKKMKKLINLLAVVFVVAIWSPGVAIELGIEETWASVGCAGAMECEEECFEVYEVGVWMEVCEYVCEQLCDPPTSGINTLAQCLNYCETCDGNAGMTCEDDCHAFFDLFDPVDPNDP